jgi:hypothetical protein
MGLLSRILNRSRRPPTPAGPPEQQGNDQPPRVLFLDDDPVRAELFRADHPDAVWVQTAAGCIERLVESWEEVHLDHDLGGEHFVDHARDDCGMEVVRWLCLVSRPHLSGTRFFIHSHNPIAATVMGMEMMTAGYVVELRPFGAPPLPPLPDEVPESSGNPLRTVVGWLRSSLARRPAPAAAPPEKPDSSWSTPPPRRPLLPPADPP